MRSIDAFTCEWQSYNAAITEIVSTKDPVARRKAAVAKGIPARVALMAKFTTLIQELLATVSTIEGSGTLYNVLSHGSYGAVGPAPTAQLVNLTGGPLPAGAVPPLGWPESRPPIARVQVMRTMLAPGEPLRIRAIVLTPLNKPPSSMLVRYAPHGSNTWQTVPMVQVVPRPTEPDLVVCDLHVFGRLRKRPTAWKDSCTPWCFHHRRPRSNGSWKPHCQRRTSRTRRDSAPLPARWSTPGVSRALFPRVVLQRRKAL